MSSHDPNLGQALTREQILAALGALSDRLGKEGTKGYFGHLAQMLKEEHGVAEVVLRTKSNYSAPADAHMLRPSTADRIRKIRRIAFCTFHPTVPFIVKSPAAIRADADCRRSAMRPRQ